MQNYLKLPLEDYTKIQEVLKKIRNGEEDVTNGTLYVGNILFEVTHDWDSGQPVTYSDDIFGVSRLRTSN